MELLGP
jgi:hypothetical protein